MIQNRLHHITPIVRAMSNIGVVKTRVEEEPCGFTCPIDTKLGDSFVVQACRVTRGPINQSVEAQTPVEMEFRFRWRIVQVVSAIGPKFLAEVGGVLPSWDPDFERHRPLHEKSPHHRGSYAPAMASSVADATHDVGNLVAPGGRGGERGAYAPRRPFSTKFGTNSADFEHCWLDLGGDVGQF